MAYAGSTEPEGAGGESGWFDPSKPYELDPQVALRREPFGALAYHYGNRRLNFVRSHELVALLSALADYESATDAMDAAAIEERRRPAVARALSTLVRSEVIRAR